MADDIAAPEPADPPFAVAERTTLESWLEFHRATLLLTCDGLSDEQRKRRPVATSLMSLHGLVRHLAGDRGVRPPQWARRPDQGTGQPSAGGR